MQALGKESINTTDEVMKTRRPAGGYRVGGDRSKPTEVKCESSTAILYFSIERGRLKPASHRCFDPPISSFFSCIVRRRFASLSEDFSGATSTSVLYDGCAA